MIIDITQKGFPDLETARPHGPCTDGFGSANDDVFHVEFDGRKEDLTVVVVRSVSAVTDRPPTALQPLGEVVDPELLDAVVEESTGDSSLGGEFSFTYEGFEITVVTDGHLWLERL